MKNLLQIFFGGVIGLMLVMAPVAKNANVAEVANELHHYPNNVVTKELQPDRVEPPDRFYNGTLESIPGVILP